VESRGGYVSGALALADAPSIIAVYIVRFLSDAGVD